MSVSETDNLGRVKTCENCVRAKIRCSRASPAQSCDRCLRLHKDCYFRPTKTRNPRKRATRIGVLEDKVDQILGEINRGSLASPQKTPPSPQSQGSDPNNIPHPCDVIEKGLITHDEANRLLDIFHETTPCFPFVQLPRDTRSQDLRSEKPFLLLSILIVSSFQDVPLHLALEEVSTAYLGGPVLRGEHPQPLDLLQGLLVSIAGSKKKLHLMRFSVYLNLANSIIRDFRMDRPAKLRAVRERIDVMECAEPPAKSISTQNQEMRALIGYYILDSTHTVISQQTGTMPWSQFIESCAEKLSQEGEFPADRYMLGQVRFQHMLERIDSLVKRGFSESQARPVDIEAIVHSLQSQAQECKAQFLTNAGPDSKLTIGIQSHTFEIHLHQTVFFDVFPAFTISSDQSVALLRVDALCHGLAAAKQCLDSYFGLPVGTEKQLSYTQWTSVGFCVAASCKLVLASLEPSLRHHDQVKSLREALNMRGEVQKLSQRMNSIDQECKGGKWDQHELFFYREWLTHLGEWFEAQYRLAQSDSAGENNNGIVFASENSENNVYDSEEPDAGFPWLNLQDVTIEEMLNAWLGPAAMY